MGNGKKKAASVSKMDSMVTGKECDVTVRY